VSGAPCVDSSPCSTRSRALRAWVKAVRFYSASSRRVSISSIRLWNSMDVLLGVSVVLTDTSQRKHKPCQPCHCCQTPESTPRRQLVRAQPPSRPTEKECHHNHRHSQHSGQYPLFLFCSLGRTRGA
jgi:hypothetical protein